MIKEGPQQPQIRSAEDKFFATPVILIFITVFIDLIGFGMVIPILPFYAETPPFNATPFEIGMLVAIYSWMQFIFAPILGRLSDLYGRRPVLIVSLFGSAVGYFIVGYAGTLFVVFAGRVISGITGGNISTAQAYIADVTSRENRARGMALFGAAFGLGFVLGPAIAGVLSKYGTSVPFYVAAAISLLNAVAVYFLLPESARHTARAGGGRPADIARALAEPRFGLVNLVYFLLVTAFSIMTYAYVLYTAFRFGFNAEQNGYLFTYVGFISIVGQGVLFGALVKRYGETPLAAVGCMVMAASLFSFPFIGPAAGGLTMLLAASALLSLGNAMASPSLTSIASKISHEHEQGRSLGIMQSGASLARAIGPTIGGFLLNNQLNRVDNSTVFRTFTAAAAIMLVAFFVAVYFARFMKGQPAV
jgi:DHA1 family tetracycline resistance protein-like MFS transporter